MNTRDKSKGFSLVEILLAVALFSVFALGVVGLITQGWHNNRLATENTIAKEYASEGIEALRSIANQSFATLASTASTGIAQAGGVWTLSGANNTYDNGKYTRVIAVADVYRDGSGNVVSSGGILDSLTKKVISTVTWNFGPTRPESTVLTTYLTGWRTSFAAPKKNGILVYGDGGTTSDAIKYQTFDDTTSTWSVAAAAADVDTGSTNKALRVVKVYSSATRNEKIMISRHLAGTNQQFIYAQVWNGSSWGNVTLLSNWTANTFLDAQNFDGAYLANGDFVVVYNDFTATPKSRVWNGTSWGSAVSLQAGQSYPVYVVAKARPGTNEMMVVISGQGKRTETQYYSGAGYATANWTFLQHATNATVNTVRFADFDWSPQDPTKGALVYEVNTKYMTAKIFTANGSGGGSWSTAVNSPAQSQNVQAVSVIGRKGANEFMACNEDNKAPDNLACYEISSFTPTWTTPTNNLLTASTVPGTQFSMDYHYELSGAAGLTVYSDNTANPQFRTYDPTTNAFSGASALTTVPSVLNTVRIEPKPDNDDAIVLLADKNLGLYSVLFDGSTNAMYTTPSGRAMTVHGTNGSASPDHWYDFSWDQY